MSRSLRRTLPSRIAAEDAAAADRREPQTGAGQASAAGFTEPVFFVSRRRRLARRVPWILLAVLFVAAPLALVLSLVRG